MSEKWKAGLIGFSLFAGVMFLIYGVSAAIGTASFDFNGVIEVFAKPVGEMPVWFLMVLLLIIRR